MLHGIFKHFVVQPYWRRAWRDLLLAYRDTDASQNAVLQNIYHLVAGSSWAANLGWTKTMSWQDFSKNIPVTTYVRFEPFVEDVFQGHLRSVFSSHQDAQLIQLALTSGTTGRRKMIPVTNASFANLQRTQRLWGAALYKDHPELFGGKILSITGPREQARSAAGIIAGDVSGLMTQRQNPLVRSAYVTSYDVASIADQYKKYQAILSAAVLQEDLRLIATATPATLLALARFLNEDKSFYLNLIRTHGRDARRRIRELHKAMDLYGSLRPQDVWPRLRILATWSGGGFSHLIERLRGIYGSGVCVRDLGLISSEGFFTLPLQDWNPVGVLDLRAHYYEFAPYKESSASCDYENILSLSQTKDQEAYGLVVSSANGLVRYALGDVVRREEVAFHGIPTWRFLHKEGAVTDLTGEKLTEYQVQEAVKRLLRGYESGLVEDFILLADDGAWASVPTQTEPSYTFVVSTRLEFDRDKVATMRARLEAELAEENFCYGEHRSIGKLAPLQIKTIDPEVFENVLAVQKKLTGGNSEQFKPKRVLPLNPVVRGAIGQM